MALSLFGSKSLFSTRRLSFPAQKNLSAFQLPKRNFFQTKPSFFSDPHAKSHGDKLSQTVAGVPVKSSKEFATGMEKFELEYGKLDQAVLKGDFGTAKNPVVVPSVFDSRIVGCVGGSGYEHELLWHEIKAGSKPTVCFECGQFFVLQKYVDHRPPPYSHGEGHGHDSHGHYSHGHDSQGHGSQQAHH